MASVKEGSWVNVFYAMIACDILAGFMALLWLKPYAKRTIQRAKEMQVEAVRSGSESQGQRPLQPDSRIGLAVYVRPVIWRGALVKAHEGLPPCFKCSAARSVAGKAEWCHMFFVCLVIKELASQRVMTNPSRQFSANASSFFFERDEFDYAVGAVSAKLAEGSRRRFLMAAAAGRHRRLPVRTRTARVCASGPIRCETLVGGAIQALLRETGRRFRAAWPSGSARPSTAAWADVELARLGRAYKQLQISFRQTRGDAVIELMSSLAKRNENDTFVRSYATEPENGEDGRIAMSASAVACLMVTSRGNANRPTINIARCARKVPWPVPSGLSAGRSPATWNLP